MNNAFSAVIFNQYAQLAGSAALVELKLRLLADLIPELQHLAHTKDLSVLEDAITNHYRGQLGDQIELITKARQLRNKILHSDFKAATNKIEEASPGLLKKDTVTMLKLQSGELKSVSDSSKREGRVFGWLLDAMSSGLFTEAGQLFGDAYKLLDGLTFEKSTEGMTAEEIARLPGV